MSTPVPQVDQSSSVARMLTGLPVSSANHMRWNNDLLFHNCYVAHPIVSASGLPSIISPSTTVYYVGFKKSPGVNVLKIAIEPNVSAVGTRPQLEVIVTSSAGTVNWIESGSAAYLDGTNYVACDSSNFQDNTIYTNHLDVSALTNGTFYDLIFTCTDKAGGATRSLYSINVTEVPLADVDPINNPSTDLGADASWLMANNTNRIVDGTTALSYGLTRVLDQLETARYQRRQHWQIIRCEDTTGPNAWNTTATAAGTAFPSGGTATYRFRARPLHGTSGASAFATFQARIRYQTSGANKPTFRFAVTPVGGATTNTDWQLSASAGVWTATTVDRTSATMTVQFPCTGTDAECDLTLYLWNDVAGTVYVSQVLLCAKEG